MMLFSRLSQHAPVPSAPESQFPAKAETWQPLRFHSSLWPEAKRGRGGITAHPPAHLHENKSRNAKTTTQPEK
jgi:hypothetical protein